MGQYVKLGNKVNSANTQINRLVVTLAIQMDLSQWKWNSRKAIVDPILQNHGHAIVYV